MGSVAATLVALAAVAHADGPRHPGPSPGKAATEASSRDGLVVLATPGPDRVLFRAGTFTMGSHDPEIAQAFELCKREPAGDDCVEEQFLFEQAAHPVYLDDFWLDRTEVTVARYQRCVAAGRCSPPPYASGGERFDRPQFPVSLVSWNDARTFCAFDGGRLPTEAEWERAARGLDCKGPLCKRASPRRYPWGDVYNPFLSNHGRFSLLDDLDDKDGFLELAPVDSYLDGRTPEGLADMAGNVEEWVSDWFAPEYPQASQKNPQGPSIGDYRVIRGGGFVHGRPWLRGVSRQRDMPSSRRAWRGFRCAYDPT